MFIINLILTSEFIEAHLLANPPPNGRDRIHLIYNICERTSHDFGF